MEDNSNDSQLNLKSYHDVHDLSTFIDNPLELSKNLNSQREAFKGAFGEIDFSQEGEDSSRKFIEQLHLKDTEILNLKNELTIYKSDSKKMLSELMREAKFLKTHLCQSQGELNQKLTVLKTLESQYKFNKQKLEEMNEIFIRSQQKNQDDASTIQHLEKLVFHLGLEKENHIQSLRSNYEEQLDKIKHTQSAYLNESSKLRAENYLLNLQINECRKELEITKNLCFQLEHQFRIQSDKFSELSHKHLASLEAQKADLAKANEVAEIQLQLEKREGEVNSLKIETSKLKRQVLLLENDRYSMQCQLGEIEEKKKRTQPQYEQLQESNKLLRVAFTQLKKQYHDEILELRNKILNLETAKLNDQSQFQIEREDYRRQKSKQIREIEFLMQELEANKTRNSELIQKCSEKEKEIQKLVLIHEADQRKVETLILQSSKVTEEREKSESYKNQAHHLEEKLNHSNIKFEELFSYNQELQSENAKIKILINHFKLDFDLRQEELKEENKVLEEKINRYEQNKVSLEQQYSQQIELLQVKLQEKDSLVKSLEQRSVELQEQKLSLEENIVQKDEKLVSLVSENIEKLTQFYTGKENFENEKSRLAKESIVVENRLSLLNQQESRLEAYNKSLNKKQLELMAQFRFLLNEYRSLEKAHPLQDYLNITESELNRMEVQLRKTPTISVDRSRLEQSFQDLMEQRNLVRDVIDHRKMELSKKMKQLSLILEKAKVDFLPPPPPISLLIKS